MPKKPPIYKTVTTLKHDEAKRKNIPSAEHQSVVQEDQKQPKALRYARNTDLDPQLVWRGKDEQDWSDLVVHAPPLYIQEKVHPKVLIDDLLARTKEHPSPSGREAGGMGVWHQPDLFADFNGMPAGADKTDFYQHDQNWSNRMILGDSLQVMASLAEREGLRGKVQCIYFDPPYGIKFNSNFQWSTTSRDVKDGNAGHITREPEQVKAFRDTWRDGIHSYLTYLRDRLTVARDLLADSGSIFVQIGDENVHRVRALMDEVFGEENIVASITVQKTAGQDEALLNSVTDYVLWYARKIDRVKFRRPLQLKMFDVRASGAYGRIQMPSGMRRSISPQERSGGSTLPSDARVFQLGDTSSLGHGGNKPFPFEFEGKIFLPTTGRHWSTHTTGMKRLAFTNRLVVGGESLRYVRFLDDFPASPLANVWQDTGVGQFTESKIYVVQTLSKIIQRCLLMSTDPGDLVLDPTCGSGTTAYVAEQWGRRWITIDTSRVALALARARIMGARYSYYLLADSREGQIKEAEISGKWSVTSGQEYKPLTTAHQSLRMGFVYERVPHITLKSIANNAEIDVIWEQFEQNLAPLRQKLSKLLTSHKAPAADHCLQEWEIPREAPSHWPPATQPLLTAFWRERIERQKAIDASIAAKAEFEYLYDKPYDDKKKVRVAGPFTVESLSPHRVLGVDEDDDLIDPTKLGEGKSGYGEGQTFEQMILENLKTAGVQQAHKADRITFTSLTPWPGDLVCAEGRYEAKDEGEKMKDETGKEAKAGSDLHNSSFIPHTSEKRAAIFIGPEFGTVSRPDLVAAAREAGDAGFDVLIACAFNYEAHATEFSRLGRIPVLKARMNADLHMAEDLKATGKGNLFVIFGEPDIEVVGGLWLVARSGRLVANYECVKELSGVGSLEEINRLGGTDLPGFKRISARGTVRVDQPTAAGVGLGGVEHRGGSSEDDNGGVPPVPERGRRVAGGSRNPSDHRGPVGDALPRRIGTSPGAGGGNRQDAGRAQALAGIETLNAGDFPLSLTTNHLAQVTVHGVDVFDPSTGEVRSDGADGIACWFIDTDYNEESFFVRHAYFLGQNDPYSALKTTLKAEINPDAWSTLHSDTSRPFDKPKNGRVAVKVINHLGDEVMKVFRV